MKQQLEQSVAAIVLELFSVRVKVELTRPDEQFGDYATNVALQLAKQVGQNPRAIAETLATKLQSDLVEQVTSVSVAGPGFLNLTLTDASLIAVTTKAPTQSLAGQSWIVEYSCPNAFKDLHTGHLYNTIVGDVLSRLLESAGATVHRTSFGGDVGLHVGKCLWGIIQAVGGELPEKLSEISSDPMDRANWLSQAYVSGAAAYESDEAAKEQIMALNKAVYTIHRAQDHESAVAQLYWTCRQWSYDYFEAFYQLIQVDDMRYYPESQTTERGLATVHEQLAKGNLEKSDGAVVFHGDESQNLHTRVFITSQGLPTYETKDVGVILAEQAEYNFDHRVLITGNDQTQYMRVVFAAMDTFFPGLGSKMTHLTNGTVRFGDGQKMSSRLGNVSRAVDVVAAVEEQAKLLTENNEQVHAVALGAIKYEFSRYRLGGDIAFDINESVSLQGNSGPYLQYAHARARSILAKTSLTETGVADGDGQSQWVPTTANADIVLEAGERTLLRKIAEYSEVLDRAVTDLMPHHICGYLYELAQTFNSFYEHNRVIDNPRQELRLALVTQYADTLKSGLQLLGIDAPERM
ncbi:arginine--tRNA ligase [Aeromicrobium sp.]|nr:arginine--tRNA ligase [Candidatus Saccharibacteria bacterium]